MVKMKRIIVLLLGFFLIMAGCSSVKNSVTESDLSTTSLSETVENYESTQIVDSMSDKKDFADSELYTFFFDSISELNGSSLSYNSEKLELCITNHIELTSTIEDNGAYVKLNMDDFINDSDKYFNSTRYDCQKVFDTIDDYTQSICKVSQLFRDLLDESGFADIDVLAKILSESDKEVVCIKNGKIEKNIFDEFKATYESAHSPDNKGPFEDSETYNSIVSIFTDSECTYEYDNEKERLTFYYNTDPLSITKDGKKYSFDYFVENREEYVDSGKYNITKILQGVEEYNNKLCELNQALRDNLDRDGYTNIDTCTVLQTSNGETVTSIENGSIVYYMFAENNEPLTSVSEGLTMKKSDNSISNGYNQKCEVDNCSKNGIHTVIGASGKIEYYCDDHYKEMESILGKMEQDVGSSTASKHICEVDGCTKEGNHSMVGLNGNTEYYCSQHYNEMLDIINDLFN